MATWIVPALKAVLPHVGTIISAAAPVFTKRSADAAASQAQVLQQQISELQAAAAANDRHIKELAGQIQSTISALERGASAAERRHRFTLTLLWLAVGLSLASLGITLYLLTGMP